MPHKKRTPVPVGQSETLEGPWSLEGQDAAGWIEDRGNVAEAVAYSTVFWPDLIEYRSCVFLGRTFDTSIADEWFASLHEGGRVESTMNHLHITDIFEQDPAPDPKLLLLLASRMKVCWEAKLRARYPGRTFLVEVSEFEEGAPLDELTITFRSKLH